MLIENLYAGWGIPSGTARPTVAQIMDVLILRLASELQKQHLWLASCFVAVRAGEWRGERLRTRRVKLARLIGECAEFLGVPDPTAQLPIGWEKIGLCYGFDAIPAFSRATGVNPGVIILCEALKSRQLL